MYTRCLFIDRIATESEKKLWKAVHLENDYVRLMILPEIGGRIHIGYDKTTGYDFSIGKTSSSLPWLGWQGHGYRAESSLIGLNTTGRQHLCR